MVNFEYEDFIKIFGYTVRTIIYLMCKIWNIWNRFYQRTETGISDSKYLKNTGNNTLIWMRNNDLTFK